MKTYQASLVGLIITLFCVLTTLTFIVPFLTIMPLSLLLEMVWKALFPDSSYAVIGSGVLISFFLLFVLTSWLYFRAMLKRLKNGHEFNPFRFAWFLVMQLFIIHPLLFYLNTSQDWSSAGDGQFILGILYTFPVSSMAFVLLGIVTDILRRKGLRLKNSNSPLLPADNEPGHSL